MKRLQKQHGFTLVELMIATTAFSVILLGATMATIQVGRLYYKGVIMSRTQQASRRVMDEITRPIQFSGSQVRLSTPKTQVINGIETGAICVGNKRFTYGINAQVDPDVSGYTPQHRAKNALYQDQLPLETSECSILDLTQPLPVNGKELLEKGMRLAKFDPQQTGNPNIWQLELLLIYGDDDLLVPNGNAPTGCAGLAQGSQWCATSYLLTQVYKRIN